MELPSKPVIVRQVFANEFKHEFDLLLSAIYKFPLVSMDTELSAIYKFPLVSMDTEFPGTLFKPSREIIQEGNPILNYRFMKNNVNALNIIQLGLTLSDPDGNLPDFGTPYCYIWEFNFKDFDLDKDQCDMESIKLLERQGIDFVKNKAEGIDSRDFAAMVLNSGLLINRFGGPTWITFHGAYDFGFLVKILTQQPLRLDFHSFMRQLMRFFGPKVFDVKHTFKFFGLIIGLEKIAKQLDVARIAGLSHQAGSDSLLTLQCFMKLKKARVFESYQRHQMLPPLALYGLVSALG